MCRRIKLKANAGKSKVMVLNGVNARDLQLECARVLHETLLVPVFMYDSETMLWKEKGRPRVRAV